MVNLNQFDLLSTCRNQLTQLSTKKILLAYSGGVDSSVLLDCLHKIRQEGELSLRTMHVNHGLSSEANIFENHCIDITRQLNIQHHTINININSSSNIEELCRKKRYEVLTENCQKDEVIFTAHHEEDQIETFLLRLIRGSGARGLSSMKIKTYHNNKTIFRPFLKVSKSAIDKYCGINKIPYIVDSSNNNSKFDRNFIRNNVLPLIKSRWISINKSILNNIDVQDIQSNFIMHNVNSILPKFYLNGSNELSVSSLNKEESYTQTMLIHEWVLMQTGIILNLKQIYEILKILQTNNDSNPLFTFNGISISKNRDVLKVSMFRD